MFKRYKICCSANNWADELKAKVNNLAVGRSIGYLVRVNFQATIRLQYDKTKILERMGLMQFMSMDDFICG